jgi:hypothetical protein
VVSFRSANRIVSSQPSRSAESRKLIHRSTNPSSGVPKPPRRMSLKASKFFSHPSVPSAVLTASKEPARSLKEEPSRVNSRRSAGTSGPSSDQLRAVSTRAPRTVPQLSQ